MAAAVIAIIAGMGGTAAWDRYKEFLPALKNAGSVTFSLAVVVFIVALVLFYAYSDLAVSRSRQRHAVLGGVVLLLGGYTAAVYYMGNDNAAQVKVVPPAAVAAASATVAVSKAPSGAPPHVAGHAAAIFDATRLSGQRGVIALAAQGDAEAIEMVSDALAVPLERRMITPDFIKQKYLERALSGEPGLFDGVRVPPQLHRILVLKIDRAAPRKTNIPQDAVRITETWSIALIDAHQGSVLFKQTSTVDGDGFSEDFARDALKENLQKSLVQVKDVLASGR